MAPFQLQFKIPFSTNAPPQHHYSALPTSCIHTSTSTHTSKFRAPRTSRHHLRDRLFRIILTLAVASLILLFTRSASSPSSPRFSTALGRLTPPTRPQWLDQIAAFGLGGVEREEWGCRGWDPELPEISDPAGCLKARQYRQTMRVLEREKLAKHDHWYFTLQHNLETFQNVSRCFLPVTHANYTACPDRPLVLNGWWYAAESLIGGTSGEIIWQGSVVKKVVEAGLYWASVGPYINWIEVAEMMPDVYRQIWVPDVDSISCITDPRCIAKEHYVPPAESRDLSLGIVEEDRGVIPIWRIMAMDYWGARPKQLFNSGWYFGPNTNEGWSFQPLGQEWIATPWPLPGAHFHLAYSIEDICTQLPITPHEESNNSALLLMKRSAYLTWPDVVPAEHITNLSHTAPFDILSTAKIEDDHPLPEGIVSLGPQSREDYDKLVGDVKVLVGIGHPKISPSVYTSLCRATPVVIPHAAEDPNWEGWNVYVDRESQHGPAARIGPPYVYSYHLENQTSFQEAIMKAYNTPIERYIPPEMSNAYALAQTRAFLDKDYKALFEAKVAANGGKVPSLIAGARESCFELKRCRKELPAGWGSGRRASMLAQRGLRI